LQQISAKVNSAKSLPEQLPVFMARATIHLDVLSTQVTIQLLPERERGKGPMRSIAQCEKGSIGIVVKLSAPILS
jgi:hypothetical protein